MKKPASVHIDIAEFAMTVMEIPESERSEWLLSLVKCLSYADPSLNSYGAKLLGEVEQYREAERLRKEKYKEKEEPKGKTRKDTERHGKTDIPKSDTTEQTEQNRQTDQKEKKENKEKESPVIPLFEDEYSFDKVWSLYGKKGNRKTSERKWNLLTQQKKRAVFEKLPGYIESTPDIQFRKNFETYLNQESWNDEIFIKNGCKADQEYLRLNPNKASRGGDEW